MTLIVVCLFICQTRGVCVPLQRIDSRNNMFSCSKAAICTQLPSFGSVTLRHVVSQSRSRFKVMIIIVVVVIITIIIIYYYYCYYYKHLFSTFEGTQSTSQSSHYSFTLHSHWWWR